jgi:hypothetical protein
VCVGRYCRASIWGAAVRRLCVPLIVGFAKGGFPLCIRKTICSATGPSRCSWQQTQHNITAPALLRVAHYTHVFLSITCFAADQGSRLCSKPASRVSLVMIHLEERCAGNICIPANPQLCVHTVLLCTAYSACGCCITPPYARLGLAFPVALAICQSQETSRSSS